MSLTPADIRVEWPKIRVWVKEACGAYPPEEVYAACRYGHAHLYTSDHGFVVLERYTNDATGQPEVLVLLAHGLGDFNMLDAYSGEIEEIARNCGAKSVVFRRLKDNPWTVKGWRMRAAEYVKEL